MTKLLNTSYTFTMGKIAMVLTDHKIQSRTALSQHSVLELTKGTYSHAVFCFALTMQEQDQPG
jgi:hypothetical protein